MCGLAGWLGPVDDAQRLIETFQQALAHRGPDSHGSRVVDGAGLIHTRLKILDLTPTGAQPMDNETGSVTTVFNGELYNHAEIRRALESKGHVFRGRSDTEVLPHLFEEQGRECVEQLRGMFALALLNQESGELLLARDRFGIKPLFYAIAGQTLYFASEIGALRKLPGVDLTPDRQAIADYTSLLFIPAPLTIHRGIRALAPGERLVARHVDGTLQVSVERWHRWSVTPDLGAAMDDVLGQAGELFDRAIASQLESDVPLGAMLSGGIDSSLLCASAQSSLGTLSTFTVDFADRDYSESALAESVAAAIGSQHTTLPMPGGKGTFEDLVSVLRLPGQPFADTSIFGVSTVCRAMRQHVTVALSGDGGDEGFGGYNFLRQAMMLRRWGQQPSWLQACGRGGLKLASQLGLVNPQVPARLRDFRTGDPVDIVAGLLAWIRPEEQAQLLRGKDHLPARRWFEPQWEYDRELAQNRDEYLSALLTEVATRLVMAGDYLVKVDSASMAVGLEVRVPLLDEQLFEFGLSLPHALKTDRHQGKQVLRQLAATRLPKTVAQAAKHGFGVPVDTWLDPVTRQHVRDVLLDSQSPVLEHFEPSWVNPIVTAFAAGDSVPGISRQGLSQRVIMLLALQLSL